MKHLITTLFLLSLTIPAYARILTVKDDIAARVKTCDITKQFSYLTYYGKEQGRPLSMIVNQINSSTSGGNSVRKLKDNMKLRELLINLSISIYESNMAPEQLTSDIERKYQLCLIGQ